LADRHEVLRSRFVNAHDGPCQVVDPSLACDILYRALSGADALERELAEEAALSFDLEKGPPLRARILQLAPQEHVLVLSLHHIVCDGWSLGVLLREWSEFYNAAYERRATDLPLLPVQYQDYAAWQRQWLQDVELERQMRYWRERLAGLRALALP
ncbi:condensation domain-containing protein, partial [Mesorhizobium mediterraneum]|uniref:condensation domain-containing protein n=1 Tax=Mesorhizobium mediterraneum TaxID=43617 RepID=UPI001AED3F9A